MVKKLLFTATTTVTTTITTTTIPSTTTTTGPTITTTTMPSTTTTTPTTTTLTTPVTTTSTSTTTTVTTTTPATTTPSCEPYQLPNFDTIRNCYLATETDISLNGACDPNLPAYWDEDFNPILGHTHKHGVHWPDAGPEPDCWGYKRCMKFCPDIYPDKIHVCVFDCPCKNGKPMQFNIQRGGCEPKIDSTKCDTTLVHSHCEINSFW